MRGNAYRGLRLSLLPIAPQTQQQHKQSQQ